MAAVLLHHAHSVLHTGGHGRWAPRLRLRLRLLVRLLPPPGGAVAPATRKHGSIATHTPTPLLPRALLMTTLLGPAAAAAAAAADVADAGDEPNNGGCWQP